MLMIGMGNIPVYIVYRDVLKCDDPWENFSVL